MDPPTEDLHDISDPHRWLPGIDIPLWAWLLAIAILGLAAAYAVIRLRRKAPDPGPARDIYDTCRRQLLSLRESLDGRPLPEVATAASLAVRQYLAEALDDPALYETHEETLRRSEALAALPTGAQERLRPLLATLSSCKYGPLPEDPGTASALVDNCLEVLQGVESTRIPAVP